MNRILSFLFVLCAFLAPYLNVGFICVSRHEHSLGKPPFVTATSSQGYIDSIDINPLGFFLLIATSTIFAFLSGLFWNKCTGHSAEQKWRGNCRIRALKDDRPVDVSRSRNNVGQARPAPALNISHYVPLPARHSPDSRSGRRRGKRENPAAAQAAFSRGGNVLSLPVFACFPGASVMV